MIKSNLDLLKMTISEIGSLIDEVVFVGGITTFLYLTTQLDDMRTTIDVDLIIDATVMKYQKAEMSLQKLGFQPDMDVRCRYKKGDIIVDLMPVDQSLLGFSNRWYQDGIKEAEKCRVGAMEIKILSLAYFIATKIEAFKGRGKNDYYGSKDIEDIITVLAGRKGAFAELEKMSGEISLFLRENFSEFLEKNEFLQSISGNLPGNSPITAEQFIVDLKSFAES